MKPMQRKAHGLVFVDGMTPLRTLPDDIERIFTEHIARMDREEVVPFEPLMDEGIPVVRE